MRKIILLTVISIGISSLAGCGNTDEKAFKVNELVDKITADKDAWKDKEVTVTGYVRQTSSWDGQKGYGLLLIDNEKDESRKFINCNVPQGVKPEGIATKTVEVKGKIGRVTISDDMKSIMLDSCEVKK